MKFLAEFYLNIPYKSNKKRGILPFGKSVLELESYKMLNPSPPSRTDLKFLTQVKIQKRIPPRSMSRALRFQCSCCIVCAICSLGDWGTGRGGGVYAIGESNVSFLLMRRAFDKVCGLSERRPHYLAHMNKMLLQEILSIACCQQRVRQLRCLSPPFVALVERKWLKKNTKKTKTNAASKYIFC